ncbi:MAG: DUF1501 domain-containing protein [Hyphomicrobiales bacterium]
MIISSRRRFLTLGLAGAGTLVFPGATVLEAAEPVPEPHFFLLIVMNGGADPSYMFDARPLSMTAAGRIQNYLGKDPDAWSGANGARTFASELVKPLARFRDRFSVINGVHMAQSFDGHLQNMNFLFTGDPFGGDSFVPHLNLAETGREPKSLDAVLPTDPVQSSLRNHSGVIPLRVGSIGGLSDYLRRIAPPHPEDELMSFVRGRIAASEQGAGRMAAAAALMHTALDRAPEVHDRLAKLTPPDPNQDPEQQCLSLIAQCFRLSLSRSAIYVLPEQFDVHAANLAKDQPKLFGDALGRVASLLKGLETTPFNERQSLFDVTSIMIASEFGRTLRAPDRPVDDTGTNHNPHANSIILGGKGVRPGLVIGATDFNNAGEAVSKAHLALDPELEKTIGRPFDFATMRPRNDLPENFDIADYLTIGSVINTLYGVFRVPKAHYRTIGNGGPAAPVLYGLES